MTGGASAGVAGGILVGDCTGSTSCCGVPRVWRFDSVVTETASGNAGSVGSGRSCCWLCCSRLLTVKLLVPSPADQPSEECSEGTVDHGVLMLRSHGEDC